MERLAELELELDKVSNASRSLPDELVERIISRMPFPSIFTARCLSKAWLARFSPISSLGDDLEKKNRAILFQDLVRERCSNWDTFSIVCLQKRASVAYNWMSETWQRLPPVNYLPRKSHDMLINGALVLACYYPEFEGELRWRSGRPFLDGNMSRRLDYLGMSRELYIANILTGRWKVLPPRPNFDVDLVFCDALLTNACSESYKVIVFARRSSPCCWGSNVQIYDSESDSWSTMEVPSMSKDASHTLSSPVLLNGVLYMAVDNCTRFVHAYDVEAGTSKVFHLTDNLEEGGRQYSVYLVVCNSNLMMVTENRGLIQMMEVDLDLNQLVRVARGPPSTILEGNRFQAARRPAGDGTAVYFGTLESDGNIVGYNVHLNEWVSIVSPSINPKTVVTDSVEVLASSSSGQRTKNRRGQNETKMKPSQWCLSTFEPGLNPFIEV